MTPTALHPGLAPAYEPFQRLLTAADLAALPDELPSGPILYELDHGRLIVMALPGRAHASTQAKFTTVLTVQGEQRGLGKVLCGDVGIILWRNPDRVVGADVAFVSNASLPIRESQEGFLETIPEAIVEVRSKNDTLPAIERKVADYFRAGVKVVLVPDPTKKTITVYRPGQTPMVLTGADVLTLEDIIPGFRMPVAEAFE